MTYERALSEQAYLLMDKMLAGEKLTEAELAIARLAYEHSQQGDIV